MYPRIPHRIDGELLRYAARFGLLAHKDDQIDEHDRYAIRAGFWREIDVRTGRPNTPRRGLTRPGLSVRGAGRVSRAVRERGPDPVGSSLVSTRAAQAPARAADACARCAELVKTYPAARGRRGAPATPEVRATDGISLDVRRGEIFGLLGPNGAGKSTLVRQLTGLMRPDSGSVEILGHDIVRHPERAARLLGLPRAGVHRPRRADRRARRRDHRRGCAASTPREARAERDAVLEELGLDRTRRRGR